MTDHMSRDIPMVFGMDRLTDERSLTAFLQQISRPALLEVLIPRLSDDEIEDLLNYHTKLMQKHLSEKDYHELFLGDSSESTP